SIHLAMTAIFSLGSPSPASLGGIRLAFVAVNRLMMMLSLDAPGVTGSSLLPPSRNFAYDVISNLPFFFLASWQAQPFSLRMGATSLMELTGPFGAWACAAGAAPKNTSQASARPSSEQRMQQQECRERNMMRGSSKAVSSS